MITGKYCNQHHCHSNDHVLADDEVCWPALLRDAGYFTSLVGKLHLWEQYGERGYTAVDHGFQYRQMIEGKVSLSSRVEESGWYFEYLRDRGLPMPHRWKRDPQCARMGGARISEYDASDHIDGVIGSRAVRQILEGRRMSQERGQPFCLQVGICSPHEAYDPPRAFYDMYEGVDVPDPVFDPEHNRSKSPDFQSFVAASDADMGFSPDGYDADALERIRFMRRCYLATVTFVDHQVGRIVAALKEAGIYENTAIIFLSDHGEFVGDRGGIQKDLFFYEQNVHVPLIVRAPFLDAAPGVCDGPVQNIDVFATVLDLADVTGFEPSLSRSLLRLVRDPSESIRDAAFAESFDRKMVRHGSHKLIVDNDSLGLELYDLERDPGETVNLARDPRTPEAVTKDSGVLGRINALLRRLVGWQQECEAVTWRTGRRRPLVPRQG